MKRRIIVLVFVTLLAGTSFAFAAKKKVGTTGADFLKTPIGARAAGMAGAFGGLADDVNAIYWNPAGLIQLPCWQVSAMHSMWLQDIYYDSLAFASPLKKFVLGGQFIRLDAGSTEGTDIFGVPTGDSYSASDLALGVSGAFKIGRSFSLGMNLKNIRRKLGEEEKDSTIGIDFGSLLSKGKLSLGFVVQNIGGKLYNAGLPLNFKIGSVLWLGKLAVDFDCNIPTDNSVNVALGMEYWFKSIVALRGGYNSANNKETGKIGLTCGAGVRLKDIQVDYAFVPYGDLGSTHFLSMIYNFGVVSEEEVAARRRAASVKAAPKPKEKAVRATRRSRRGRARVKKERKPQRAKTTRKPTKRKKEEVIAKISATERELLLEEFASKAEKKRFAVEATAQAVTITLPTHFKFGDAAVQSKDKTKLTSLAKLLKKYPELKIRVQTHTAGKGSSQFKTDVTTQQAANIKEFLASKGVPEENISLKGCGDTQPIGDLFTEEGRVKSCRVEFVIY